MTRFSPICPAPVNSETDLLVTQIWAISANAALDVDTLQDFSLGPWFETVLHTMLDELDDIERTGVIR